MKWDNKVVNKRSLVSRAAIVSALVMSGMLAGNAYADTQPAPADTAAAVQATGDITVTARRKNESILQTPIAITAMSGDDLKARGAVSLQDISNFAPGLNMVGMATSGGRADRSFQEVVLRGITPADSVAQTTSLFIDGVPVSSAIGIQTVLDPDHIEVLKGPQAAYFGRQTFAGAINVVNKLPTSHLTGEVDASVGTRNSHDITAELSGPIFGDVLGFRITAKDWKKGGSYKNAGDPSETLGDQSTRMGTAMLVFKPSIYLTVKAFGSYTYNKDGPAATGLLSAYGITGANGTTVATNQSNCTVNGHPWICGTLPGLSATSPAGTNINGAWIKAYLANPNGRVVSPSEGTQGYGMVSRNYHAHLTADWKIGESGFTLSSLTGYNHTMMSELADFSNTYSYSETNPAAGVGGSPSYFNYPFLVEGVSHDFSQEVRLSFDNGGRFKGTVGASYLYANNVNSSGGGFSTLTSTASGATANRTFGAFYGLGYDLTDKLTVNFDGRYQVDKVYGFSSTQGGTTVANSYFLPAGYYAPGALLLEKTFKNFMPRVIAQYKYTPGNMAYATFSTGVNPGRFNTSFLTQAPAALGAAAAAGVQIEVQPEKIDNWEIGFKGRAFDRKLSYQIDGFLDYWYNQITNQTLTFPNTVGAVQQVNAYTNSGRTRLTGIEAQANLAVSHRLSFDLNGAYIDSTILAGGNYLVSQLTGITNFRGKSMPFSSKWSGNVGATYTVPVGNGVNAYGRADFIYKSGTYTDQSNLTRTPDMTQVNLHLGAQNEHWSVEAYVNNLFDNKAFYSAGDGYAVNSSLAYFGAYSAVVAQLRDLRTVGIKLGYKF